MKLTPEMIQQIQTVAESAFIRIGAADVRKKVDLTVRFAWAQSPVEITLDSETVTAVAVDLATVFSVEDCYHQVVNDHGIVRTAEAVQALSIVIAGDAVKLCKSTYDVIPGSAHEDDQFINARYWTTTVYALVENYIC